MRVGAEKGGKERAGGLLADGDGTGTEGLNRDKTILFLS